MGAVDAVMVPAGISATHRYRWQDPLKVESAESGVGVFSAGASFPTHAACAKQCAAKHAV